MGKPISHSLVACQCSKPGLEICGCIRCSLYRVMISEGREYAGSPRTPTFVEFKAHIIVFRTGCRACPRLSTAYGKQKHVCQSSQDRIRPLRRTLRSIDDVDGNSQYRRGHSKESNKGWELHGFKVLAGGEKAHASVSGGSVERVELVKELRKAKALLPSRYLCFSTLPFLKGTLVIWSP